jgi:transcriptional regulator with XRE-family HTH domain
LTTKDSVLTDTTTERPGSVEEITAAVALHVRALRTGRGWSLDELSGRSSVSKGMLVQIEAARTNPSIGTLARIADAFGVTVGRLLQPANDRTVHLADIIDAPILWRGGRGGMGRLLRGLTDPDYVELWDWRFAPNERHESEDHQPGTRELVHVLVGEIIVTVDGVDYTVLTGQTLDFRSDRLHIYYNPTENSARVMMVVVIPPGEFDRRMPRQR